MGEFLNSAARVLREEDVPLSHREITRLAIERGYLETSGKTPSQTMKSKLSTDILRKRESSVFMRTDKGLFALRRNSGPAEYVADRYQKALLREEVVVFDAELRPRYVASPGVASISPVLGQELLGRCRAMQRTAAEEDKTVIQLVSAFIVRFRNRFLTYKRTRRLPESRLHGYYSISFGGHLNPDDIPPLWNIFEPEAGLPFLERELSEELRFHDVQRSYDYLGVIWDDRAEVSKQHLGIVYEVQISGADYEIGERGFLMDPRFETLDEIDRRIQ